MMKLTLTALVLLMGTHCLCSYFTLGGQPSSTRSSSLLALRMGLFDGIAKAFANEEVSLALEG